MPYKRSSHKNTCAPLLVGCADKIMSSIVCTSRVLSLPGSCLASGDENGLIKIWDWRAKSSITEFQAHSDFISDLTLHEAEQCLVAVSGDGSLSLNDLKAHKVRLSLQAQPPAWRLYSCSWSLSQGHLYCARYTLPKFAKVELGSAPHQLLSLVAVSSWSIISLPTAENLSVLL